MSAPRQPTATEYRFGPFRLDAEHHQLFRDGELVQLPTRKALETLLALVERRDRIVGKEELLSLVWPDAFVSDDSLTQCISMVRRALDDDSAHAQYISTIPRRGYRFTAPVEEEPASVLSSPEPTATRAAASPHRRRTVIQWGAVGAVTLAIVAAAGVALRPSAPSRVLRLTHHAPPDTSFVGGGVLSPDAQQIAFVARSERTGLAQLWIRALDSRQARAIPGTERATRPFWSPDGRALAFFADDKLRRVELESADGIARPPQVIATVGYTPAGGSWGTGDEILFATRSSRVYAVAAGGGEPRAVTQLDSAAHEVAHRWPQFLPDGRHFLYVAASAHPERARTYVASLDDPTWRVQLLDEGTSPAFFAAPHYLLYVRERVLMAQPFDLRSFTLQGSPVAITSDIRFPTLTNGGMLSAAGGLLAVWGGPDRGLIWFSRTGERTGAIDAPTALHNPAFSPDERQLVAQGDPERAGIWLVDLERDAAMNLSVEGATPVWAAGSDEIAFFTTTATGRQIRLRRLATGDKDERVIEIQDRSAVIADWSADGRYLLNSVRGTADSRDVWILPLDGANAGRPYLDSPANEVQSRLSPDGRWVAYTSDESGSWQVYVQSFPVPGMKRVISPAGGAEPQWRRDGAELFYVAPDATMMAVGVTLGPELRVEAPTPLFRAPLSGDLSSWRNRFVVTSDGQRFLIDGTDDSYTPIEIIVNWTSLVGD